jgi:hypothetical protein
MPFMKRLSPLMFLLALSLFCFAVLPVSASGISDVVGTRVPHSFFVNYVFYKSDGALVGASSSGSSYYSFTGSSDFIIDYGFSSTSFFSAYYANNYHVSFAHVYSFQYPGVTGFKSSNVRRVYSVIVNGNEYPLYGNDTDYIDAWFLTPSSLGTTNALTIRCRFSFDYSFIVTVANSLPATGSTNVSVFLDNFVDLNGLQVFDAQPADINYRTLKVVEEIKASNLDVGGAINNQTSVIREGNTLQSQGNELQSQGNTLQSQNNTLVQQQTDALNNQTDKMMNGYDPDDGGSVDGLDGAMNTYGSMESTLFDSAASGLGNYSMVDITSNYDIASSVSLVSSMLFSLWDVFGGMDGFGIVIAFAFAVSFSCMVVGFYRYYRGG